MFMQQFHSFLSAFSWTSKDIFGFYLEVDGYSYDLFDFIAGLLPESGVVTSLEGDLMEVNEFTESKYLCSLNDAFMAWAKKQ